MGFGLKRFLPRTLFGRSLLILVTPVVLIQVITTLVFFDRHWSKMTTRLSFAVAGEIALVAEQIEGGDVMSPGRLKTHLGLSMVYDDAAVIEGGRRVHPVVGWEILVGQTLARELKRSLAGRPFNLDLDFQDKRVRVDVQLDDGVLYVVVPQNRLFSSSGYIFLLWMTGSSLLLLLVAVIFMRNQIRPIRKLAAAAERFGKGRDVAFFKPEGAREVRQAAEAFILMNKRIRRQVEQRTTMLAGVSHDLKTPLTRLRLQLEMLGRGEDIQDMKADIQDMETMISGYLEFVRGEGDEDVIDSDVTALLDKIAGDAGRQGIDLSADYPAGLRMDLRPLAIERCLNNIISNAGAYGQHVWLSALVQAGRLKITIEDDGPGVDEAEYDDLFRPFYRGDKARSGAGGHVGLGLPIAMDIVHAHGGKIALERSAHGGLKVLISLPV